MKYIVSNHESDVDSNVWLLGDIHIGHNAVRYDMLQSVLTKIDPTRDRIILMGDLVECATKSSVGAGLFDTSLTPDTQIERAVELFMPYRHIIDGVLTGNHEQRIYNLVGIDVAKRIAEHLGVPYLRYSAVIKYVVGRNKYYFNVIHGNGGGGSVGGALNKCIKMADKTMSDVYAMGHVHKLATSSRVFSYPKVSQIEEINQQFVLTGSFLGYDDEYPDQMNLDKSVLGCAKVTLSAGVKNTKVELVNG